MNDLAPAQDRMLTSHRQRARYERLCFLTGVGTVIVLIVLIMTAVAWPPAMAGAPDWGRAVIEKAEKAWAILIVLFTYLTAGPATTLLRGHMDARLDSKP